MDNEENTKNDIDLDASAYIERVERAFTARRAAAEEEAAAVVYAFWRGHSWAAIGEAAGMTRQAVWAKYHEEAERGLLERARRERTGD